MSFILNKENKEKFKNLKTKYPDIKALMLPLLWIIQYQEGWISPSAMEFVGKELDTGAAEVYGVVTFYTMFNLKPIGKTHIEICKSISCQLNGASTIIEHCKNELNVGLGESSADGLFTVSESECLGACGGAVAMSINGEYHEDMSKRKIDKIIENVKKANK